ncbi:hypothetical protein AAGG52_06370 [Bacillus licheniformis]
MAGMLANYGYATFAIPYFQYKQLPKNWLKSRLNIFGKRLIGSVAKKDFIIVRSEYADGQKAANWRC